MLYYNPEQYSRLEFCSFDFNHSVYRLVVTVLMFNDVPLFMAATDNLIQFNLGPQHPSTHGVLRIVA